MSLRSSIVLMKWDLKFIYYLELSENTTQFKWKIMISLDEDFIWAGIGNYIYLIFITSFIRLVHIFIQMQLVVRLSHHKLKRNHMYNSHVPNSCMVIEICDAHLFVNSIRLYINASIEYLLQMFEFVLLRDKSNPFGAFPYFSLSN